MQFVAILILFLIFIDLKLNINKLGVHLHLIGLLKFMSFFKKKIVITIYHPKKILWMMYYIGKRIKICRPLKWYPFTWIQSTLISSANWANGMNGI